MMLIFIIIISIYLYKNTSKSSSNTSNNDEKEITEEERTNILNRKKQADASQIEIIKNINQSLAILENEMSGYDKNVNMNPNDVYLAKDLAEPNVTKETITNLLKTGAFSFIPEVSIKLTAKAVTTVGKLLIKQLVTKTASFSTKLIANALTNVAKGLAKLENPIGWTMATSDAINLVWDLSDVGKLSGMKSAKTWLELHDEMKKQNDSASGGVVIVKGPLTDMIMNEGEQKFTEKFKTEMLLNVLKIYDTILNEVPNIDSLTDEQLTKIIGDELDKRNKLILNMTYKSLCENNGGKYMGESKCSYKTKDECDKSYTWPLRDIGTDTTVKSTDLYSQWENNQCVLSYGGQMRTLCEKEGTDNMIEYDYNNKICRIKEPYCKQFGYQFKTTDPEVNGYPNCYKTVGRDILEAISGQTIVKDIENLSSGEENCGNRCTTDQYCLSTLGKGGVCIPRSAPGESCPTSVKNSCKGASECRLSSEGIAAAVGIGAAVVGPLAIFLPGLAISTVGGGRSVSANLGKCTAGKDGKNPSSYDNPGHYLPLGNVGCSVAWQCPDGTFCKNVFEPCQPKKKKGEWCSLVEQCQDGLWCGGIPVQCREPKKDGDYCDRGTAGVCGPGLGCGLDLKCHKLYPSGKNCTYDDECESGKCNSYTCTKIIQGVHYIPLDGACGLARGSCEPGTSCSGGLPIVCVKDATKGTIKEADKPAPVMTYDDPNKVNQDIVNNPLFGK